ncbi:MYB-like transcription factor ETC3 [Hevea brasiliensis]|uniref:MYB-like transcription factor ETC3 n=1 Tax=Hevea brasiliensis TaxID=3981 RepID=UPI0025D33B91|nr:MYB-like transcription factor ETC3 [Hevea brasiliensis]
MDDCSQMQNKTASCSSEEVSSIEWESIKMTEQEEDLIHRMYRLVGNRWDLIAGRIPGRKAEEIERFWTMRDIIKNLQREEISIKLAETS